MVDSCWEDNQIAFDHPDPHPAVILGSNIEKTLAVQDISYFLILVYVLVEEDFHFVFVEITEGTRGYCALIAILIATLSGKSVHIINGAEMASQHTDLVERGFGNDDSRVVVLALVLL